MRTGLLSLLLAALLAGGLSSAALAQGRAAPVEPAERFEDFDDEPDYPRQHDRGHGHRDEEGSSLFWLFVIIVLGLAGGGGWYWWDHFEDGCGLLD